MLATFGGAATLCLLATSLARTPPLVVPMVIALFAASSILFSSLTIQVTDRSLRWHFGPGLFRKEVPLADVEWAEVTETKLVHGWGIHLTPRGWLYNVSGFQAVAVRLRTGKQFLLGSDEPERLRTAILRALP